MCRTNIIYDYELDQFELLNAGALLHNIDVSSDPADRNLTLLRTDLLLN